VPELTITPLSTIGAIFSDNQMCLGSLPPNSNELLSPTRGADFFRPSRSLSETRVTLRIDRAQALDGISSFDSINVVREFETRYPRAFQYLRKCGILANGECDVIDPYTGIIRREPFNNIFEHSVAVGFAAQVIARELLRVNAISQAELDAAVERALLHDATKPYEIFRRRIGFYLNDSFKIFEAGRASGIRIEEIFTQIFKMLLNRYKDPEAFAVHLKYTGWYFIRRDLIDATQAQTMVDAARRIGIKNGLGLKILDALVFTKTDIDEAKTDTRVQKLLASVFDYGLTNAVDYLPELLGEIFARDEALELSQCGAETGWPSYGRFLSVSSEREIIGIRGNWVEAIIHVADDMTLTSVPREGCKSETYFLTTNERLFITGPTVRGCKIIMNQWIGACSDGSVVELSDSSPIPSGVRPTANVATLMVYISDSICESLKELISIEAGARPAEVIKRLINDSYERLMVDQSCQEPATIAA
jgi:hypothetical protein